MFRSVKVLLGQILSLSPFHLFLDLKILFQCIETNIKASVSLVNKYYLCKTL